MTSDAISLAWVVESDPFVGAAVLTNAMQAEEGRSGPLCSAQGHKARSAKLGACEREGGREM